MADLLGSLLPIAGTVAGGFVGGPAGAAVGGSLGSSLAGGGSSKPGGSGGAAPQAPDVQSSTQSTNQTVTNNISVGDFGQSTRDLLPFLSALPSPYATPTGYSADTFLTGRSSITTYALAGFALLAGVLLYRKLG